MKSILGIFKSHKDDKSNGFVGDKKKVTIDPKCRKPKKCPNFMDDTYIAKTPGYNTSVKPRTHKPPASCPGGLANNESPDTSKEEHNISDPFFPLSTFRYDTALEAKYRAKYVKYKHLSIVLREENEALRERLIAHESQPRFASESEEVKALRAENAELHLRLNQLTANISSALHPRPYGHLLPPYYPYNLPGSHYPFTSQKRYDFQPPVTSHSPYNHSETDGTQHDESYCKDTSSKNSFGNSPPKIHTALKSSEPVKAMNLSC